LALLTASVGNVALALDIFIRSTSLPLERIAGPI
jgi:hypothetical protein